MPALALALGKATQRYAILTLLEDDNHMSKIALRTIMKQEPNTDTKGIGLQRVAALLHQLIKNGPALEDVGNNYYPLLHTPTISTLGKELEAPLNKTCVS